MDSVTKWFLSGLRDLSLFLEHPSLSGTRFYGRALSVRVETQGIDALVEKTDWRASCPHNDSDGFASLSSLSRHNESPRKRESLCWQQAHNRLKPAINKIRRRSRKPYCSYTLEQRVSRQEFHTHNQFNPTVHGRPLALIPSPLHLRDSHQ